MQTQITIFLLNNKSHCVTPSEFGDNSERAILNKVLEKNLTPNDFDQFLRLRITLIDGFYNVS